MRVQLKIAAALALAGLVALLAAGPGSTGAAPNDPGCDDLDAYASGFAPLGYDLDHVVTLPLGPVTDLTHAAWVDSIWNNSAFLDTVLAGTFTVAEFIKDRPELDMEMYRAWLDTLVHPGDDVCELVWTLHGTAQGDTTFSTLGISRNGAALFEPLLYFNPTEEVMSDGAKESTGASGWVKNGFGIKAATWTINVAIKCNNCRIIDPAPYTTIQTYSIFLWDCKGDFVEAKYFEPAPCCPDDQVECLKSVVQIAVTSGGKSSVVIKHKDWLEVKFEGWFGCKANYPYTFHLCCTKVMTTKTTDVTGVPTRDFAMGEPVWTAGDNLPPNSALMISVFPNQPIFEGMPIPPRHPGTAMMLLTDAFGQVMGTDLGGPGMPILMHVYEPWPEPTWDLGYDFIVDINENGFWDPEEPALDVGEDGGFGSMRVSGVPQPARPLELNSHPNPFNPTTTVRYSIGQPGRLSLKVYNLRGQLVRTLVEAEVEAPEGSVVWDGTDNRGRPVVSGVYFVHARAHGTSQVMKVAVIK